MNTFKITAVRTILDIERPIVVLEVLGNEPIIRTPKELLTDMQNSGRALTINAKEFKHGFEFVPQTTRATFIQSALDCINAEVTGDIRNQKAGDKYIITLGHPALTDSTHPLFGKVKEGEEAEIQKDGVRVEGFLSIPLTAEEKFRRDTVQVVAQGFMAMMGMSAPAVANNNAVEVQQELPLGQTVDPVTATTAEAFGTTVEVGKK